MKRASVWSNRAFAGVLLLLVPLGVWWTVLIGRLVDENHALRIASEGDTVDVQAIHDRRRLMVWGESGLMGLLAVAAMGLSYGAAVRERQQLKRIEGILAANTHELKTPLAGVRALLESLQSGVLPPAQMGPHLQRGLDGCTRLEHLVDAVVTWQGAIAHQHGQSESRTMEAWLTPSLPGARLELSDPTAMLAAPPDALRVILENLWDNAKKYGGKEIVVTSERTSSNVQLHVRDDGLGFEPGDAERLFEPYQRLHTHTRGTGLGLYISRSLARALGGDLTARSPGPGAGATFTLSLPLGAT